MEKDHGEIYEIWNSEIGQNQSVPGRQVDPEW